MAFAAFVSKALAMKQHWAQLEERGVIWGMHALLKVYLWFGRRVLQVFLYPVVSYYWLFNSIGRQASRDYLRRVSAYLPSGHGITGSYWHSYKHFVNFANIMIDKLAAWSGTIGVKDVDYVGREAVIECVERGQGVLILAAHLGNMEVCRLIATLRKAVTVNVLVHTKHAEKFNAVLNQYADLAYLNLIQVTEINAATAMLLQDKIDAGELVVITADRTPVKTQQRVTEALFLGQSAPFPQGPYILGGLLKCPVFTMFCLKHQQRYRIYFEPFCEQLLLPRKTRDAAVQRYAQQFADRLQYYCLKEPMQWFNFYDFWQA